MAIGLIFSRALQDYQQINLRTNINRASVAAKTAIDLMTITVINWFAITGKDHTGGGVMAWICLCATLVGTSRRCTEN